MGVRPGAGSVLPRGRGCVRGFPWSELGCDSHLFGRYFSVGGGGLSGVPRRSDPDQHPGPTVVRSRDDPCHWDVGTGRATYPESWSLWGRDPETGTPRMEGGVGEGDGEGLRKGAGANRGVTGVVDLCNAETGSWTLLPAPSPGTLWGGPVSCVLSGPSSTSRSGPHSVHRHHPTP